MATRRGQRPPPQREPQAKPLNAQAGKTAPKTAREWVVFRAGVLEGIEKAHREQHEKAAQFLLRAQCGGIDLSTPSAAAAEEAGDAERSRVKTPAEFTPQLRKRRA